MQSRRLHSIFLDTLICYIKIECKNLFAMIILLPLHFEYEINSIENH